MLVHLDSSSSSKVKVRSKSYGYELYGYSVRVLKVRVNLGKPVMESWIKSRPELETVNKKQAAEMSAKIMLLKWSVRP